MFDKLDATFIDASLFMGMHSHDDEVRLACKGFFVEHLTATVVMSLEQVGRCDALVWRYPRAEQDAYYPFMDKLHTDMPIQRLGYSDYDIDVTRKATDLSGLDVTDRLTIGMVLARGGRLVTVNQRLLNRWYLPVQRPVARDDVSFPADLEALYGPSLALRVLGEDL